MTKRPLCMVCLVLMLLMCVADRAGFPLIRGNPVPENVDSWIPVSYTHLRAHETGRNLVCRLLLEKKKKKKSKEKKKK